MIETDCVAALLDKLTPEGRELVQQLQALTKEVMPTAPERIYLAVVS